MSPESRRELLEMANLVARERTGVPRFVYANCHLRGESICGLYCREIKRITRAYRGAFARGSLGRAREKSRIEICPYIGLFHNIIYQQKDPIPEETPGRILLDKPSNCT